MTTRLVHFEKANRSGVHLIEMTGGEGAMLEQTGIGVLGVEVRFGFGCVRLEEMIGTRAGGFMEIGELVRSAVCDRRRSGGRAGGG